MNVNLEEWQVKQLRIFFAENDKTQLAHWAFKVFDDAIKAKGFYCYDKDCLGGQKCQRQCEKCLFEQNG